jgi:phosphatidylinositol 4-kinase type 2
MQDVDFQEKMFAKQMAVVKGQAWNVVETLKTPDHGPLELTRRARVCVWDDLVEVPVVVPLRAQSPDTRRRNEAFGAPEEMDISAAATSDAPKSTDLLNINSPEEERSNPFNISRQSSQIDVQDSITANGGTLSPPNVRAIVDLPDRGSPLPQVSRAGRPGHRHGHSRTSFDDSRRNIDTSARHHNRRHSHQARLGSYITDDVEGDLGYSAAADREANGKMVIVERLETVKSKNPVFTWC